MNTFVSEQFYYVSPLSTTQHIYFVSVCVCAQNFIFKRRTFIECWFITDIISLHQIKETLTTIHAYSVL